MSEDGVVLRLDFTEPEVTGRHAPRRLAKSTSEELHACGCGVVQQLCLGCGDWVCHAPGHLAHRCARRTT